jgi:hypothetical protein
MRSHSSLKRWAEPVGAVAMAQRLALSEGCGAVYRTPVLPQAPLVVLAAFGSGDDV